MNTRSDSQTPLNAILLFTVLNSLSCGTITSGIFFLTRSAYSFSDGENYALGFALGVGYIVGALGVGPLLRRFEKRSPKITTRSTTFGITTALAILACLPAVFAGSWTVWTLIIGYSMLCGALWPIVESYLSGGLEPQLLRRILGRFNVMWSSTLVVGYWAMAPFVEARPLTVLVGFGLVHALSFFALRKFADAPGRHIDHSHEPHPRSYVSMLKCHRVLLAVAYIVIYALVPLFPSLFSAMGISPFWQAPLASVWLVARVLVFASMDHWKAWHGRWGTAFLGAGTLFSGAILIVIAPVLGAEAGTALLILALALFGAGVAILYMASLYYAMVVGSGEVDAGGAHEAMIGIGYAIGPLCGLVGCIAIQVNLSALDVGMTTLVIVAGVSSIGVSLAWKAARHGTS